MRHPQRAPCGRKAPVHQADLCSLGAESGENESPVLVAEFPPMTFENPVSSESADPEVIDMVIHDLEIVVRCELLFKMDVNMATRLLGKKGRRGI